MSTRAFFQAIACCLVMVSNITAAHALTQQELVAKLEAAGYSQVRDIKSSAEGTSVKATKNGKEVSLVVDSSGQVKEQQQSR
jgi:Peptidase propeptide and YPEB domain